jgi:alkaline phosphatase
MKFLTTLFLLLLPMLVSASEHAPRNVILFLGDGMGISTITAARIYAGQLEGGSGEEYDLSWDRFPNVALVKTFAVDRQVPDSAGTMSSIMTGQPGGFREISVDASVEAGDCAASLNNPLPTLLERAEQAGFRTGVVSTARLTHATPAATYAHVPDRSWENDSAMSNQAREEGCRDIARQLVEFGYGDGIEVMFGGGRREFLPRAVNDPEYSDQTGRRLDQRNLIDEWLAADKHRTYVWNLEQFEALDPHGDGPVLGLFEADHMQFEVERRVEPNEPDIVQMVEFAIGRLQNKETGFFLMVEGGRIDHAHHANNAAKALSETVMMNRAVTRALELTDSANTLILVTADHSHTMTMSGYPPRGNPILGTVHPEAGDKAPEPLQLPYTTLGYTNGPGYRTDLPDLNAVDTTDPDYQQFAGWPKGSETHGGEDVAAYAHGLGADRLHGVIEQRRIYDVMAGALFGD